MKAIASSLPLPKDVILGVTYWCNSRCIMCDIWKMKPKDETKPEDYAVLPSSFRDINISGGEPFLRRDLPEIIRVIKGRCPKAQIVISSNGFLSDHIAKMMETILDIDPTIGVGISIDGVGEMHERVRRIPQAFEKSTRTVRLLKGLGMKNLRIAFTIVDENTDHLMKTYRLAQELDVDFTMAYAQSSEHYFGGIDVKHTRPPGSLEVELTELKEHQLRRRHPKQWFRAFFTQGILQFAKTGLAPLPTRAGRDHCYIDSWGNVFPSVAHPFNMGNIRKTSFKEIWNSEAATHGRKKIDASPSHAWMVCTARSAMKRHLPEVLWWILKSKTRLWLGQRP